LQVPHGPFQSLEDGVSELLGESGRQPREDLFDDVIGALDEPADDGLGVLGCGESSESNHRSLKHIFCPTGKTFEFSK